MEAKQHASEQPTNHRRNQKEIKICMEKNVNENMTTQHLWDSVKAVLREGSQQYKLTSRNKRKSNK